MLRVPRVWWHKSRLTFRSTSIVLKCLADKETPECLLRRERPTPAPPHHAPPPPPPPLRPWCTVGWSCFHGESQNILIHIIFPYQSFMKLKSSISKRQQHVSRPKVAVTQELWLSQKKKKKKSFSVRVEYKAHARGVPFPAPTLDLQLVTAASGNLMPSSGLWAHNLNPYNKEEMKEMNASRWRGHRIKLLTFRFMHTVCMKIMASRRWPQIVKSELFSETIEHNHLTLTLKH